MLLLLSWGLASIRISELIPEEAIQAQAMTIPPPCLTYELVCLGAWADPFNLHALAIPSLWKMLILLPDLLWLIYECICKISNWLSDSDCWLVVWILWYGWLCDILYLCTGEVADDVTDFLGFSSGFPRCFCHQVMYFFFFFFLNYQFNVWLLVHQWFLLFFFSKHSWICPMLVKWAWLIFHFLKFRSEILT